MKSRPLQLLMVDGVRADVKLFEQLFANTEPQAVFRSACSAERALSILESADNALPDIILLDLNLPVLDGHALLKQLKSHPKLRQLPVVILTASDREEDVSRAYHSLASAYLIKPATPDGCRAMVETLHGFWQHVSFPCVPG